MTIIFLFITKFEQNITNQINLSSLPSLYIEFAQTTFVSADVRENKCPQWSADLEAGAGSMTSLKIAENTPIGTEVYILTALDTDPLYYFIRAADELEHPNNSLIFNVSSMRTLGGYIGKVELNQKLDYELKNSYSYIAYAFDGTNLIERLATIQVTNVDDEPPKIVTNTNRNFRSDRFEYEVLENMSVGFMLNMADKIQFVDNDTLIEQLRVKLVDAETGLATIPFSIDNSGLIQVVSPIDFEIQNDYLLKLIVKVGLNFELLKF